MNERLRSSMAEARVDVQERLRRRLWRRRGAWPSPAFDDPVVAAFDRVIEAVGGIPEGDMAVHEQAPDPPSAARGVDLAARGPTRDVRRTGLSRTLGGQQRRR